MATIEATLVALARIDSGSLAVTLDERIYPEPSVRDFAAASSPHYTASVKYAGGELQLVLVANDPTAARLQIGNALTDLLQHRLQELR